MKVPNVCFENIIDKNNKICFNNGVDDEKLSTKNKVRIIAKTEEQFGS